jgi:hypothetical protein
MTESAGLERGYRRLLACYPRAYRRDHADEILAVLMAAVPAASLLTGRCRARVRCAGSAVR